MVDAKAGGTVGGTPLCTSSLDEVRRRLKVQYKDGEAGCFWWADDTPRREVDYLYLDREGYEAVQGHVSACLRVVDGEGRFVVRAVLDRADDGSSSGGGGGAGGDQAQGEGGAGGAAADEDKARICCNCMSPDHPPNKCLKNPSPQSPLFVATAECTHCEQRGHVRGMCKAEGGPCYGMPGIFPHGFSAVCTQPMIVTVAADATQDTDTSLAGRGAGGGGRARQREVTAMRKACRKPKSEYEQLQEKLHFAALRHSHDDFLVLFGDKCERYKRKHHTPSYAREELEVGFRTPIECCYVPVGVATRKIQTRMKDLTKGLRYPPATSREQLDRKRKAERAAAAAAAAPPPPAPAAAAAAQAAALPPTDPSARKHRARAYASRGGGGDTGPASAAAAVPVAPGGVVPGGGCKGGGDEEGGLVAAQQLKRLLDVAERRTASDAFQELRRRRLRVRERLKEEVREMAEARRQAQLRQHEGSLQEAARRPFTQQMFLQHFAFPKDALRDARRRLETVKKGETVVGNLDGDGGVGTAADPPLFPQPALRPPRRPSTAPSQRTSVPRPSLEGASMTAEAAAAATEAAAAAADATTPRKQQHQQQQQQAALEDAPSGENDGDADSSGAAAPAAAAAPPSAAPAIVNWRLRCVEQFDAGARPPPPRSVGGGASVSSLSCGYWSARFLSGQFRHQIRLEAALERRTANRDRAYRSAGHLASVARGAARQAAAWGSAKATLPAEGGGGGGGGGGGVSPVAAAATSAEDLWTRAVRQRSLQTAELEAKGALYGKVLRYCDTVLGAPSTELSLQVLGLLRGLLLAEGMAAADGTGGGSHAVFVALVGSLTPEHLADAEVGKVLHCIRSELYVDATSAPPPSLGTMLGSEGGGQAGADAGGGEQRVGKTAA